MQLPIFLFNDIFKEVIWGGNRIAAFKGLRSDRKNVGESWEISPIPGDESVVAGGDFDGMTLGELTSAHPEEILGNKVVAAFGPTFPLLIKFIDSADDLSIQVHPDDSMAARLHNSTGKTEMWYSIDPAPDAYLYAGFNRPVGREEFIRAVENHTITDTLKKFTPAAGDVFFLPAGRVHSIGRGNFVCEIQQASNITYRIYDYGRRQPDGSLRELHIDQSLEAADLADCGANVGHATPTDGGRRQLAHCRYFHAEYISLDSPAYLDGADGSFTALVCVGGAARLTDASGRTVSLSRGRSALVPAAISKIHISPLPSGAELLVVTVPSDY